MGTLGKLLGIGRVAKDVTEVFVANKTATEAQALERFLTAQESYQAEFGGTTRFDHWVNGINRLPRPFMALGTLGLFAYAMIAPSSFSTRMMGLSLVPEPLWWLLGAIVSFYFGARELHHFRMKPGAHVPQKLAARDGNAAVKEWQILQNHGPDWLDEG